MSSDFPVRPASQMPGNIDERARDIFRRIVDGYLTTGEPVGSRHISRQLQMPLSPASVRNVMQDLEDLGLIYAPHTSAGRLPTEIGLRLFVDAMLEIGDVSAEEKRQIEAQVAASARGAGASKGQAFQDVLTEASSFLSGVSRGAGLVATGKAEKRWKHIEFVRLDPSQALLVLVGEDGSLENRLLPLPAGLPASALFEASNYLNARLRGRSLDEVRAEIEAHRRQMESEVDQLTARLIDSGLASASDNPGGASQLIVRGQANLLDDVRAAEDIERIRLLFADLETKKDVIDLLSRAETADGVRIFIGSENKLFSLSGSSLIAAPFRDSQQRIVGVLGVIGPTRLNYARIVPMVDYTARVVSRMLGERD